MKSPRPLLITIIGWLFIVTGVSGIIYHATEIKFPLVFDADLALGLVVRLLAAVGGIWLLKGKGWARWLIVLWLAWHVVLSLFHGTAQLVLHSFFLVGFTVLLFLPNHTAYFRMKKSVY